MKFYDLTQLDDFVSPQDASIFDFEDDLVETCNANLAFIKARAVTRQSDSPFDSINIPNYYKQFLRRNLIGKTIGLYTPTQNLSAAKTDDIQVLSVIEINPSSINLLNLIKGWRKQFDIVSKAMCTARDALRKVNRLKPPHTKHFK